MGCGVCQGKPIDFQNMASPGQQALDPIVAGAMKQGMQGGATPFGGQLSQAPVDPILQAIQMMYGMQGMNYGGEQGGFPGGPLPPMAPSGTNAPPFGMPPGGNNDPFRQGGGPGRINDWTERGGWGEGNWYDPINNPGAFMDNPRDPTGIRRGPIPA